MSDEIEWSAVPDHEDRGDWTEAPAALKPDTTYDVRAVPREIRASDGCCRPERNRR